MADETVSIGVKFVFPPVSEVQPKVDAYTKKLSAEIKVSPELIEGFGPKTVALVKKALATSNASIEVTPKLAKTYKEKLKADFVEQTKTTKLTLRVDPKLADTFKAKLRTDFKDQTILTEFPINVALKVTQKQLGTFATEFKAKTKELELNLPVKPDVGKGDLARFRKLVELQLRGDPIDIPVVLDFKQSSAAAAKAKAAISSRALEDAFNSSNKDIVGLRATSSVVTPFLALFSPASIAAIGTLTAGVVGLGAAIGVAGVSAAKFTAELSKIVALSDSGTSGADFGAAIDSVSDRLLSLSKAVGGPALTPLAGAEAIREAVKAGLTIDEAFAGLTPALELSTAGGEKLDETFRTLAKTTSIFKLQASDFPRVAGLIQGAARKTIADVKGISDAFVRAGPTAAGFGFKVEEVAGALGALATGGILGGTAGTQLARVIQQLTGPKAEKALAQFGFTAKDTAGNFLSLQQILDNLRASLENIDGTAARAAVLQKIFNTGRGGLNAANQLLNVDKPLNDFIDSYAELQKAAAEITDNILGDWDRLKASAQALAVSVGSSSEQFIRPVRESLQSLRAFAASPETAKAFSDALVPSVEGLSTVVQSLESVFNKGAGFFKTFGEAAQGSSGDIAGLLEDLASLGSTAGSGLVSGLQSGINLLSAFGQVAGAASESFGGLVNLAGRFSAGLFAGSLLQRGLSINALDVATTERFGQALSTANKAAAGFKSALPGLVGAVSLLGEEGETATDVITSLYLGVLAFQGIQGAIAATSRMASAFKELAVAETAVQGIAKASAVLNGIEIASKGAATALQEVSTAAVAAKTAQSFQQLSLFNPLEGTVNAAVPIGGQLALFAQESAAATTALSATGAAAAGTATAVGGTVSAMGGLATALPIVGGILAAGAAAFVLFGNKAEGASEQVKAFNQEAKRISLDPSVLDAARPSLLASAFIDKESLGPLLPTLERATKRTKNFNTQLENAFKGDRDAQLKVFASFAKADADFAKNAQALAKKAGTKRSEVEKAVIESFLNDKPTEGLQNILRTAAEKSKDGFQSQLLEIANKGNFATDELSALVGKNLGTGTLRLLRDFRDALAGLPDTPATRQLKADLEATAEKVGAELGVEAADSFEALKASFEDYSNSILSLTGESLRLGAFGVDFDPTTLSDAIIEQITGGFALDAEGKEKLFSAFEAFKGDLALAYQDFAKSNVTPLSDIISRSIVGAKPEEKPIIDFDAFERNLKAEVDAARERIRGLIGLSAFGFGDLVQRLVANGDLNFTDQILKGIFSGEIDPTRIQGFAADLSELTSTELLTSFSASPLTVDVLKKVFPDASEAEILTLSQRLSDNLQRAADQVKLPEFKKPTVDPTTVPTGFGNNSIDGIQQLIIGAIKPEEVSASVTSSFSTIQETGTAAAQAAATTIGTSFSNNFVLTTASGVQQFGTTFVDGFKSQTDIASATVTEAGTRLGVEFGTSMTASIVGLLNIPLILQFQLAAAASLVASPSANIGSTIATNINSGLINSLMIGDIVGAAINAANARIRAGINRDPKVTVARHGAVLDFPNNIAGLVYAHQGEGILPPEAMRKIGPETFHAIRTGAFVPNFRAAQGISQASTFTRSSSISNTHNTHAPVSTTYADQFVNHFTFAGPQTTDPELQAMLVSSRVRGHVRRSISKARR